MNFPKLAARGDASENLSLKRLEHWGAPAAPPNVGVRLLEAPVQRPPSFASLISVTDSTSQNEKANQSVGHAPAALPTDAWKLPKERPTHPPARYFSQRPSSEMKAEKE
jgi:hypothetical protein